MKKRNTDETILEIMTDWLCFRSRPKKQKEVAVPPAWSEIPAKRYYQRQEMPA
jgi:hypothetical protein